MNSTSPPKPKRSFLGLLTAQFFGAFNDNAWKVMVFTIATRPTLAAAGVLDSAAERSSQLLATLSMLAFLLPMLAFSLPAGIIADSYSKQRVILLAKILEVLILIGCVATLFLFPTAYLLPLLLLSAMGAQSALLGPSKYGIMPEIMPLERLSQGNGLLEMWTMLAIIAGTGLGPALLAADHGGSIPSLTWLAPLWLTLLSLIGLGGAMMIAKVPVARPIKRPLLESLKGAWNAVSSDNALWIAIMGSLCYWTILSLLGQEVLVYAKSLVQQIENGEIYQGIPPASYGIGIAVGALLGGRWSGNQIEYGFIPLGAIGFAITSLLLGLLKPAMAGTIVILIGMGISSGLLIVPLKATIQWRAPADQRGSIIALGNVLDISGMVMGSLLAAALAVAGFSLQNILIASSGLVVAATALAIKVFPKALVRLCFIFLTRTCYRFTLLGIDNLPKEGPLLLASNHLSLADALFITASVDRPVHFTVGEQAYKRWWIRPFADLLEAIPLSPAGMKKADEYLCKGEVVCIFPEGEVSRTGMLLPFQKEVIAFAEKHHCPVMPVHLDNVWGSIFSYKEGRFFLKWPRQFPYPLTVSFGKPLSTAISLFTLRQAIKELECQAAIERQKKAAPLHHTFIRNVRREPLRLAIANNGQTALTNLQALVRAIAIARKLNTYLVQQKAVGIALPTSIPSVLVNIAAVLCGCTVVNLNFTASREELENAIAQSNLEMIITSRVFLRKSGLQLMTKSHLLFVEEMITPMGAVENCFIHMLALLAPLAWIEKACGYRQQSISEDTLVISFTSGSSGIPKGVILSHGNITSNVEAVAQVIPDIGSTHRLLASLPLFHSFGYFIMWLGLSNQIPLIVHRAPLDAKVIGSLVERYAVTLLLTTPEYLECYIRDIPPGKFGSLHCILTGGEKLPRTLSEQCESHFGLRPIEGYGATECSPVVATNTLNVRHNGTYQIGHQRDKVGHPLPGVAVRIVDPKTFMPLPEETEGLLLVRGPNVMKGYLGAAKLTERAMHQGWYITGDIASMDDKGFISIVGRFQKADCKKPLMST
jgi:acyl-[acyl-carrier-protein]-phospholipid O-acyltransferase/long-chain-fatty-acid--[acyl-carrier-protein] ligase